MVFFLFGSLSCLYFGDAMLAGELGLTSGIDTHLRDFSAVDALQRRATYAVEEVARLLRACKMC